MCLRGLRRSCGPAVLALAAFCWTASAGTLRVSDSSLTAGDVLPPGGLSCVFVFNGAVNSTNLDDTDFSLTGVATGSHSPVTFDYDAGSYTLTLDYSGLPEDDYTLTLLSGDLQFEDTAGNDLDGETPAWPIPPNVSGDGTDGGDFVVTFRLDTVSAAFPTPLAAKDPPGSLVYGGSITFPRISPAGDTDTFTLDVDAGQTITAVVDPDATLQPSVALFDPGDVGLGTVTPAVAGLDAVLQTRPATSAGIYELTVSGAGGTTGAYTLDVVLNAAVEDEEHDGPANDDIAFPQDINLSFIPLGGTAAERGAVLGTSQAGPAVPVYEENFEGSLGGWVIDNFWGPAGNGLWDPSMGRELDGQPFHSPPQNLYYGQFEGPFGGGNYDAGWTSGAVYSPAIPLPASGPIDLVFNHFLDIDPFMDFAEVAVDDGTGYVPLLSTADMTLLPTPGMWQPALADLTPYAGSVITLRFVFDSVEPFNNFFEGWYIDDVVIWAPGPSIPDWYAFDVTAGDTLTVALTALTPGDLELELYDNLQELAVIAPQGPTNVDRAIANFVAYQTGAHYVRVTGDGAEYSLVVTRGAAPAGGAAFDLEPNDGVATAQGLNPAEAALGHVTPADSDYYSFAVNSGDPLVISTATPADGGGEFVNALDPAVVLYNEAGAPIAGDDNSGLDGRNAYLEVTAPSSGMYTVRVYSVLATEGEVVLSVQGATGAPAPFTVAATDPADTELVEFTPPQMTVDFSEPVLITSVEPSDLTLGAFTAIGVSPADEDSVVFDLPAMPPGDRDFAVAGGAILSASGVPVEPYSGQFTIMGAPRIMSVSVPEGGVVSPGTLTYMVQFDKQMDDSAIDTSDFTLVGVFNGLQTPSGRYYNSATRTLSIGYMGLPEDSYTLTLLSGDGRFEDVAGYDLDGEPVWPLPSGDGFEGGDFVVHFDADVGTAAFPTPLSAVPPPGSMVHEGAVAGLISSPADPGDTFTIAVDPGFTLAVVVDPASTLQPTVQLEESGGAPLAGATAAGAGTDAVIQPATPLPADTYSVIVSGTGGTWGAYTVQVILNAAAEDEEHDGAPNDTWDAAQDIEGSFLPVSPTGERGAVIGMCGTDDWFGFNLAEGETASLALAAVSGGPAQGIELCDPSGTLVAASIAGATNVDCVIDNFVAQAPGGTHYVRVAAFAGDYTLVVTRDAAFDTEPNDCTVPLPGPVPVPITGAQDISGRSTALGHVVPGDPARLFAVPDSLGVIVELDPATGAEIGAIPVPGGGAFGPIGLAYDGTSLFYADDFMMPAVLYELDPDTGAVLDSDTLDDACCGLAALGGKVYIQDYIDNDIIEFDPVTDTVTNVLDIDGLNGIWIIGGIAGITGPDALLVTEDGFPSMFVHEIDPATGLSTSVFPVGGYYDGVAVSGGEIYLGSSEFGVYGIDVYTRDGTELRTIPRFEQTWALGGDDVGGTPGDDDLYSFPASTGQNITITTYTPGDDAGEFVNVLDPAVELFDPSGASVDSDEDSGFDLRNAYLEHVATSDGLYTVKVYAQAGEGEYVVTVENASGPAPAFAVAATDPPDGGFVDAAPAQIVVDFDDFVDISTLSPTDLTVDGAPATGFTVIDGDTVAFDVDPVLEGLRLVSVPAGAVWDIQGTPVGLYMGTFRFDTSPPGPVSGLLLTPASGQITLVWTNPDDADFAGVLILRRQTTAPSEAPALGATYTAGDFIGDAEVVYVGPGTNGSPSAVSAWTDTPLAGGTYYYAVFARDASDYYSTDASSSANCGDVIYVDASMAGGDGSTWALAFSDLQSALAVALPGNQIWVADGTYYPGATRSDSFQLGLRVGVYGGFAGGEAAFGDRDWMTNIAVLSGDIDEGGTPTNDCYHVVKAGFDSVLDGFTVTGGNANGAWPDNFGGGMTIRQVTGQVVANCAFESDVANSGGGIEVYDCSPRIVRCIFFLNDAGEGGGMYLSRSDARIAGCTFAVNYAAAGGALYIGFASSPILTNCAFFLNGSFNEGGGILAADSWPIVTNCSIADSTAGTGGGGVHATNASPQITNSVLWGNSAAGLPSEVFVIGPGSSPVVTYSCVRGGYPGVGNIGEDLAAHDPLFVDPATGDYRLQANSECIDRADGDAAPATDLDGNARHDDTGMDDLGVGAVTYADMGAYEFQGASVPITTVFEPSTSAVAYIGEGQPIVWTTTGGRVLYVRIEISRDNGGEWSDIIPSVGNIGSAVWTVSGPPSGECLIRVSHAATGLFGGDSGLFIVSYRPPLIGDIPDNIAPEGATVAINGWYFRDGIEVWLGSQQVPAGDVTWVSDQKLTFIVPPGTGLVDVTVRNPDGQSHTMPSFFLFAPRIDSVSPSLGWVAGGTTVTITGVNFVGLPVFPTVEFGGVAAAVISCIPTQLVVTTPPAGGSGPVDVKVTNPDNGPDTMVGGFTYSGGPGDLNGDSFVDMLDLQIVDANRFCTPADAGWDGRADPNGDGVSNLLDFMVVVVNWGTNYF